MDKSITITDVTLREFGQNVPSRALHIFTPEIRVKLARELMGAGFSNIELFSCVPPRLAPAMNEKDLGTIASRLGEVQGVHWITLVPNRHGFSRYLSMGLGPDGFNHTLGLFFSAVDAHNLANLRKTTKEAVEEQRGIAGDARAEGIRVVAYISAAFGYLDPIQGRLINANPDEVNQYLDMFFDLGVVTVTLSDLQGVAGGKETARIWEVILKKRSSTQVERLGYHPHHGEGQKAVENSGIAYDLGIRRFDASLGGTGGCLTGAPGNQPTEELVRKFHARGIPTGIQEKAVFTLAERVHRELYEKIPLGAV